MIFFANKSVLDFNVDCVVNAANCDLIGGGGVDGAIHEAAGKQLDEACKKIGYCGIGNAVITPGFNLKQKYIIHTVGPIYTRYEKESCRKFLQNCYKNCLDLARDNNIHSIAFPCISTGVYGFPLEDATKIALSTVRNWLSTNGSYLMHVHFACFTKQEYETYTRLF